MGWGREALRSLGLYYSAISDPRLWSLFFRNMLSYQIFLIYKQQGLSEFLEIVIGERVL